jgi:transposase
MSDEERPALLSASDWVKLSKEGQKAILSLVDMLHALGADVERLRVQVKELQVRLNQSSRNSSKPPSSDPPSAPPRLEKTPRGRPRGGQVGHEGHQRPLLPEDQVDTIVPLYPAQCPDCLAHLPPNLPDQAPLIRTQVWDLPARLIQVTEYQQHTVACPCCEQLLLAALPESVPPGAFGPGVVALTALLQRYRLSERETADFWQSVFGMPISLGSVVRLCERASIALAPIDAAIHACVQRQEVANLDETPWREQNRRAWLWVAVTEQASCFRVNRSRSRAAFEELLLPGYRGVVGSDRYSAYESLPDPQRQLCWAHLIRNLRACLEVSEQSRAWAEAMLWQVEQLFALWEWHRVGLLDQIQLQVLLMPIRAQIEELVCRRRLDARQAEALRADLLKHWEALWTFVRVSGVEPTNNAAERALRPAVLWRKGCFGTQSESGSRFVERLLSVVATCRQQGRQVFEFLRSAVVAAWTNQPPPSVFTTP